MGQVKLSIVHRVAIFWLLRTEELEVGGTDGGTVIIDNRKPIRSTRGTDCEHACDDRRAGQADDHQGLITDEEFKAQLNTERANYLAV